jgi:arylsulfatase A-like enzyme/thioredoxin-like negative regulator of GroEL
VLVAALGLASITAVVLLVRRAPAGQPSRATAIAPGANILFITVDTLRPDHLAPYGYQGLATPAIGRLAREGVLFKAAYASVPLTLPSHSTIFTGLLPFTHGVRDNGGFYLDGSRPTLATLLKSRGYSTAAFVSAFVLDSRWGLARGFDEYYDNFQVSLGDLAAMARVQRPGGETWAQVRVWLRAHASERFFLWMHLFDPHAPYTPPEPFRTQFAAHPYDGEIAYVDSILTDVLAELTARSLLERTLIVLVSDHGEGLGEHDEDEHGLLAYDSTLHVPWIMRLPGQQFAGLVVEQPVGLVDVASTVLDVVGAPIPPNLDGTTRAPSLRAPTGGGGDVLYAETLYPRLRFGWSELLSIRNNQFKLIRGRGLELYDYRRDPSESTNLAERQPDVAARLDQILTRMTAERAKQTPRATADPEAASRLQALGYVSGSAPIASTTESLPDPRLETGAYRQLMDARRLLDEGHEQEGVRRLETLLGREPDLEPAHRALREYWVDRGHLAEAEQWFARQLATRQGDVRLLVDIATIQRAAHHTDRAIRSLDDAIHRSPDDVAALTLFGEVLRDARQYDAALDRFTRAAALSPSDTSLRMQVAQTLFAMDRLADAESALNGVLAADAHAAGAHYLQAQIAERRSDGSRAESEYRKEIGESPWDYRARFNLAELLAQRGEHAEQLALLASIPKLAPNFHDVYFFLAKALLDSGDAGRFPEAIADAQKGLAAAPTSVNAPLGHYVLADVYRLQGRQAEAQREQAQGQALEQRLGASRP